MLTPAEALAFVAQHATATPITVAEIEKLLNNVHGTTFAQIVQVTKVETAAAHKAQDIRKVTVANIQLFNNLHDFTNAYENAVKRTAAKIAGNDQTKVAAFESAGNYFEHSHPVYSIVKHKTQEIFYLFAIYNKATSMFVHNGAVVNTAHVEQFLTPSGVRALNKTGTVTNVTHGIEHDVHVRVVKLENIMLIRAMKQEIVA